MDSTTDMELASEIVASQAIVLIKGRFEDVPQSMRLPYHNTFHTSGVRQRAVAIARAIGLSDRHVVLTDIAAAFHDTVQVSHPVKTSNGVVIRQRHAGQNEVASAQEAVDAMSGPFAPFTFMCEEYGIVASAIVATIPGWSVEYETVIQPFLTHCSHPVARAVALADLGAAGMDTACFVRDWKTLFAEEQLDIMSALMNAKRSSDISEPVQYSYRSRYVAWLGSQVSFARGRQELMSSELLGLDIGVRSRSQVRAMFDHFGESVAAARAAHALATKMDFVPLMRQILPGAFPGEGR